MDIEGLGDKLVEQLVDRRLVGTYGDLYRLQLDDLISLERMGEKSSQSLLEGIQASRKRGLARLLYGLAIRHVGARLASVLADHARSMQALQSASVEELGRIPEIGPVIAESVHSFLHDPQNLALIGELRQAGVEMETARPTRSTEQGPLAGKTLVATGTLKRYTRDEIHALIEKHGGRAATSVSSKTNYLVAGEDAGSKLEKARKLGVTILSEDDFEGLLR
jgi:DNA ligase (NAD+)